MLGVGRCAPFLWPVGCSKDTRVREGDKGRC